MHGVGDGAVTGDRLVQEVLGQQGVLPGGDDPAGVVAGVDVDQDVEVEPDVFDGSAQLRYIPGPDGVRGVGDQFRFDGGGMGGLRSAFADLAVLPESMTMSR